MTRTRQITVGDAIPDHRDVNEGNAAPPGLAEGGPAAAPSAQLSEEEDTTRRKIKEVTISADALIDLGRLNRSPPSTVPARFAMRLGATWAEALEGSIVGESEWGILAAHRTRFILAPIPKGVDRMEELGDGLDLWDQGRFDDLIGK